ncbi:MAG: hypothetical protein FWE09_03355 [Treponema sp.]|nr:hypothetical protein [Treponema sp.]
MIGKGKKSTGLIFLYGETHGVERILDRQLEIWGEYYHGKNMRHLFIELGYFSAEFLNLWMKSDNDAIVSELFADWAGTPGHVPQTLAFYKALKKAFPETVFHGVDIGHQAQSTGERFLRYLRDNEAQDSERHSLALEAIEQGKVFNQKREADPSAEPDWEYRETKLTENFIREFDRLADRNVMGIFGSAHTAFGRMKKPVLSEAPTMAERLRERYGASLQVTDLSALALIVDPIKTETIFLNGKTYERSFFGTDSRVSRNIVSMSCWRLENAYDDFSGKPTNEDVLPCNNYPMAIEPGQVFIIDIALADGSAMRRFYRSDGKEWQGMPTTTGFDAD